MHPKWVKFLKEISNSIEEMKDDGVDVPCFRGHANKDWDLLPSLFIKASEKKIKSKDDIWAKEYALYFDFLTNAGNLLDKKICSWEILFEMRHHGIPTRVLDWSENFGTALFFALNGNGKSPTIWVLDPYELNSKTDMGYTIPNPLTDLPDYKEAYLNNDSTDKPYKTPIAIIPPRTSTRIFAQKGLFTLQGEDMTPLNKIKSFEKILKKFVVPIEAIEDANKFLILAGINEYSIYPDLDGLAKYLTRFHNLD